MNVFIYSKDLSIYMICIMIKTCYKEACRVEWHNYYLNYVIYTPFCPAGLHKFNLTTYISHQTIRLSDQYRSMQTTYSECYECWWQQTLLTSRFSIYSEQGFCRGRLWGLFMDVWVYINHTGIRLMICLDHMV